MRRRAELSWLTSLFVFGTLFSCATDDDVVFEPHVAGEWIPPASTCGGRWSPTLSEDARVLAWVEVTMADTGIRYFALRRESPATTDTLLSSKTRIVHIDLSDDGRHLIGMTSAADTVDLFIRSEEHGRGVHKFRLPSDYTWVNTPRWVDENRVFFGASGPEGQGIWCWNPTDDSIRAVCVRFPNPVEQWLGNYVDLDRSGRRICFERRTRDSRSRVTICSAESGEILVDFDGVAPRFWTITPTEEEGLLYIDTHNRLRGVRLHQDESFYIDQEIYEYDISPDGRWLFSKSASLSLRLRDLRNLR